MIAFPAMLIPAAQQAGMKTPPDADDFKAEDFPHFAVFCAMQLGRSMPSPSSHWDNARIIADIPASRIRKISGAEILALGYE